MMAVNNSIGMETDLNTHVDSCTRPAPRCAGLDESRRCPTTTGVGQPPTTGSQPMRQSEHKANQIGLSETRSRTALTPCSPAAGGRGGADVYV